MNITWLKNPAGGRQTSWLFTSITKKLNQGDQGGIEPATTVWISSLLPQTLDYTLKKSSFPPPVLVVSFFFLLYQLNRCKFLLF